MAKATLNSHIADAIRLQSQYDTAYLVIGKSSPWTDDNNPPEEDENVTAISEIIGYKKVKNFSLARPLASGESADTVGFPVVTYSGQQWVLVPVDQAYEQKARWVYIESEIHPEDFPLGSYRQVGVHVGLSPNAGVTKSNLHPTEVADTGVLRFYENREPQNRTSSVYSLEQFIIKV
jgi:hypothetical protein